MIAKIKSFLKNSVPHFLKHSLWQDNRLVPFLRFARLQLIFALGEKKIYVKWIDDLMLPIASGESGLTSNYYLGLDEFDDMAFALHLLHENEQFIDVGANLGSYSLIASGLAKAQTLAYEPVPTTYKRLVENISVNNLSNKITPYMIALTSQLNAENSPKLRFSSDKNCMNSFVDNTYTGSTVDVDISSLDLHSRNIQPVLIKIDVEGFELDVLKGSSETLSKASLLAVIIEGQTDYVNSTLRDAGFVDVNYFPMDRTIQPHSCKKSNRIWIRSNRYEEIAIRLKNAPSHLVYGNIL